MIISSEIFSVSHSILTSEVSFVLKGMSLHQLTAGLKIFDDSYSLIYELIVLQHFSTKLVCFSI